MINGDGRLVGQDVGLDATFEHGLGPELDEVK